ncbi:MAG: PpiC-type peptidyl-prolyl cis-trans isomerase [Candidatus Daviesbacteria bacterium GW2011_GWB1_41_5]|uniref:PpiC-type peptidyl-prolyl cis-trans isomerase n=2 Tax=Patescibacteria group TaxID=1783273 RepID=A0A0G0WL31_9BACT|nr:MAG: PpiC-type peptidyl-prolyl cis-trans isomerase [Candidatus Daviesbacteria bacterium GW2011_GWB1_41_5]KKT80752.1 MAG: PpiC-type peptidyl-prolyl cis-trans isomerase [Candidatus Azambacteria bacterium GW2011_GWA1_44_9]
MTPKGVAGKLSDFRSSKYFYLAIIIIGLALLVTYKKEWFIAATVNGAPISNFELLSRMNQQFRSQTLSQMVNEKIILDEAGKNNITILGTDVDSKIAEVEKNVGGPQVLDSMLAQQGQTRESIKNQIKIQLIIERLYANEATISAEEVDKFLEQNKDSLTATDSADQKKEAEDTLKQQKLSQIFNEKFQKLKDSAKIQIF